ncbi:MAG: hypothetical protein ACTHMC_18780 [Pseudobacter sp.]|uniref:hypothetical protein n=1 Tax=Pseudobacter sp. TaxID=2045420 RepID=UPI003F7CD96A
MLVKADRLLFVALVLAILLHGSALLYNLNKTYDAFVHIFFADHYARYWFEPWEFRWYTGFPVTSYPPLSHQLIALLSMIGGLKFGFVVVILAALCFFVTGIYRFSRLWVPQRSAAYASLFAVLASSITQTIHIYGQLPTMVGISCLVNALPEVYAYFRNGKLKHLVTAVALLGVTVSSHHVTTIFGIIFFIAPVIATALLDQSGVEGKFIAVARKTVQLAWKKFRQFFLFFSILLLEMVVLIFPYWYWSKTDPISQVPIPHGSRDNFLASPSSGLMFFIIPLGFILLLLPFIFRSLYTRRNIFLALSYSLLLLLGTGGTTPLPEKILGKNAFNVLTLDRFTFWASVISIPFVGDFFRRLVEGDIRERIIQRYGKQLYHITSLLLISVVAFQALFVVNFHKYRSLQPQEIDMQPIISFLDRDQHSRWRFLTLGFGDQMAWLSSQTTAMSIDGNYHSARRVPEMTRQPLERLENSKFKGIPGIGSLQQFLTVPEKYHLKFIFSNDKFYDPVLFFSGWERVQRLENGIMVWQKADVPPLPSGLTGKFIPFYQRMMWGILPLSAFCIMLTLLLFRARDYLVFPFASTETTAYSPASGNRWLFLWMIGILLLAGTIWIKQVTLSFHKDPEQLLKAYYHALDFKLNREAHGYFPPGSIDYEEYTLRLSLRDGLLASYGKLDSLAIAFTKTGTDTMEAVVTSAWTTPLEEYVIPAMHVLIRKNGNWYVLPPAFEKRVVPDEHMEKGMAVFRSQGKRVVSVSDVRHDDILDRPDLHIISSALIKKDSSYVVVGEVMNRDYLPAHLTIGAVLLDSAGRMMVSYNAKYHTMHNLLPGEKTPFLIEFEETAWLKENDRQQLRFNPGQFSAYNFTRRPADYQVQVRAVVADKDLYRDHGIQQVRITDSGRYVAGSIVNYGVQEISVPQLLMATYDDHRQILWVNHLFVSEGLRPQTQESFNIKLPDLSKIALVRRGTEQHHYVNGLQQMQLPDSFRFPGRGLIALPGNKRYCDLFLNGYIGNPTIY